MCDCAILDGVVHWLDALNNADVGVSGGRDTATDTISLLDRIYDVCFPGPLGRGRRNALRPFLDNAAAAAKLDVQIALTDGLIDQIVYRLYRLSEEQVEVEEV